MYGKIFQSSPVNLAYIPFVLGMVFFLGSWAFILYLFKLYPDDFTRSNNSEKMIQEVLDFEDSLSNGEVSLTRLSSTIQ
jgi:hypothetical protein